MNVGDRVAHVNGALAGEIIAVRRNGGRKGYQAIDMFDVRWDDGYVFAHAADLLVPE